MPDPVTIRYTLDGGGDALVELHQVGHDDSWVLDLSVWEDGDHVFSHQHSIDGTPEVEVG